MYSSHLRRQAADLKTFMADETLALDPRLDYGAVVGLSEEVRERLARVRPTSIVSSFLKSVQRMRFLLPCAPLGRSRG